MADKFIILTNTNPPYEGQEIIINTDHIVSIYKDLTANNKVALSCKDNFWHVEEDLETVLNKIGIKYERKKSEVN